MSDANERTEVGRLLFEVEKMVKQHMRRHFEPAGLTMPQGSVLGVLLENGGEVKMTDIAGKLSLSNSTVSGIVDRLEKQRLVTRRRSEDDRRVVYVGITPKFMEIHRETVEKLDRIFDNILSNGTQEEIRTIIDGLGTLKRLMSYTAATCEDRA